MSKAAKAAKEEAPVSPTPTKKGKKEEEVFDRRTELQLLQAAINKQFTAKDGQQRGMVMAADEFSNIFLLRRPFGIMSLDIATAGGLPAGTLCEIVGPEGGSKSLLANLVIAGVQRTYGDDAAVAVCMTEMHYDKPFAKSCGVRVALSQTDVDMWNQYNKANSLAPIDPIFAKDQVGQFYESVHANAEGLLEAAAQQVESNLFQVVLIDSLGALMTEGEAEEGIEKRHYGGASVPITQFMHRIHAAFNLPDRRGRPNTTTIIGINQKRDNVGGGLYAPEWKIPGGMALKHGKTISLFINAGKHHVIDVGSRKEVVGKEVHWKMLKGKAGCHEGPSGVYDFYYGKAGYPFGPNIYKDLLVCGVQHGIIEQSGAWLSYGGERLGQGADNAAHTLYANPELTATIRNLIFLKAKVNFITKESF